MTSDDEVFWQLCQTEDPIEREGKLRDLCGDDSRQYERLSKLLAHCKEADRLFGVLDSAESNPSAKTQRPSVNTRPNADTIFTIPRMSLGDTKGPTNIGPYELMRLVGRGGMGNVFQAHNPTLQRDVALKIPRVEILLFPGTEHRFLREARAAARLDHPCLVSILQFGCEGPYPFIASEWCDGGDFSTGTQSKHGPFRHFDGRGCGVIAPSGSPRPVPRR